VNSSSSPLSYLKVLMRADMIVLYRNKRATIASILLPLLYLFIFNSEAAQTRLGGSLFIVAFSITVGLTSVSILGYALTVAKDRERGVFQRLRVTPAPTWVIMTSRLLVQTFANLLIAAVVLIVATPLHHLHLTVLEWILTLLASIIGGIVFLSIGQTLVGLIKSSDTINASGRIIFIVLLLLGLLGPSGILGSTMETISKWTPILTVMTVLQSTLHQTNWTGHTTLDLVASIGYIIFFGFVGIKWFKWETQ
jgi:ABC-2 type transport system permease protein